MMQFIAKRLIGTPLYSCMNMRHMVWSSSEKRVYFERGIKSATKSVPPQHHLSVQYPKPHNSTTSTPPPSTAMVMQRNAVLECNASQHSVNKEENCMKMNASEVQNRFRMEANEQRFILIKLKIHMLHQERRTLLRNRENSTAMAMQCVLNIGNAMQHSANTNQE